MLESTLLPFACGIAALLGYAVTQYLLATRRPPGFPPGPPTSLGLGNIHQVPTEKGFLKFQKLHEQYGDIVGLKMCSQNVVILSNPADIAELFGQIKYSGRPRVRVAEDYVLKTGDKNILFLQYDQYLLRWRTVVRQLMTPEKLIALAPYHAAMANKLMFRLMENPSSWRKHVDEWAFGTPWSAREWPSCQLR